MEKIDIEKIIKNGGATLNARGQEVHFKSGYQVSFCDCYTLDAKHTRKILRAVNGLLATVKPSEYVGLWVDGGKIYIDLSERIEQLSAAIVAGMERKQKSIFDWCLSRCISLED